MHRHHRPRRVAPSLLTRLSPPASLTSGQKKYHDMKDELEQLKQCYAAQPDRNSIFEEQKRLRDLLTRFQEETRVRAAQEKEMAKMVIQAQHERDKLREDLTRVEREKTVMVEDLIKSTAEVKYMKRQIADFYGQSGALAGEADQSRKVKLKQMFEPVQFVDPALVPGLKPVHLGDAIVGTIGERLTSLLKGKRPTQFELDSTVYFLPRPPNCMPLRVGVCAQHGYWFYSMMAQVQENAEFELIVEGQPNQTKLLHCSRVASEELPEGQTASYPAQLDVKRRYETGEWSVPCFSLRCVGFDMQLYDNLHLLAQQLSRPAMPGKRIVTRSTQAVAAAKKQRAADSADQAQKANDVQSAVGATSGSADAPQL
ncbi:hypothetical protein EW146_g1246 [Bondarzewia mesenterica]|uniref:DUF6697 domain-containing protein n=1 Tax=Bondarzewia mesenterica TaxID=1095465 RepID=A0A4S4M6D0_9AGAM|nr:hypothetical protein EW146_g1246 [Bondarzewia mesenterica]